MKHAKKITSILIIASMTITMFVGCSSKSADTSANTTTATTAKPATTAVKAISTTTNYNWKNT